MLLEYPALTLSIGVQDILGILEDTLKEKNWKNFELANMKLLYTPYYLFNYDTLVEVEMEGRRYSQGFSGLMAMNAVTGELEPLLTDIMEKQPVSYEKEISHDLKYEVEPLAMSKKEVADAARVKIAGQFNLGKQDISVSGFRVVYWPVWRVFIQLPKPQGVQRMDVDAVSGYPLNFEQVPIREKGWLEVTSDTLAKMKTTKGWSELGKGVATAAARTASKGVRGSGGEGEEGMSGEGCGGTLGWLMHSKMGIYSIILIIVLIVVFAVLYS